MKFVHIADMHFDIPFTRLDTINNLGEERRLEQRKIFKEIVEYIKENNIEYLFISGDFYEHEYVKQSTIEYINKLFETIPNTRIYISPGNHDPLLKNSYYNQYKWNNNVIIFNSKIQKYETKEADIYGYGFEDFYCKKSNIENIKIENQEKVNILITHADLDGAKGEGAYNAISKKELESIKFNYIALGHIHQTYYNHDRNIAYPGSTISLGFDEPGEHGMIVGEIIDKKIELKFVPLDKKEFLQKEIDITEIKTEEEIIEQINNLKLEENKYYEIIFVGKTNIEINKYKILKNIQNKNIFKIKNKTKIKINLEELQKENNLKGLFLKEMNQLKNQEKVSEEILQMAIEIGLQVLEEN